MRSDFISLELHISTDMTLRLAIGRRVGPSNSDGSGINVDGAVGIAVFAFDAEARWSDIAGSGSRDTQNRTNLQKRSIIYYACRQVRWQDVGIGPSVTDI